MYKIAFTQQLSNELEFYCCYFKEIDADDVVNSDLPNECYQLIWVGNYSNIPD